MITPPSVDNVVTAQVPRSLPLYEITSSVPRVLSSSENRVDGDGIGGGDGDSDSDSISSVYTAPEGDIEREMSNLNVNVKETETLVGHGE